MGGAKGEASPEALPEGKLGEAPREIELHYHYDDLSPVVSAPYKVTFENGSILQGTLDANGYRLLSGVPAGGYLVEYGEDARPWSAPPLLPDDTEFAKPAVKDAGRQAIEAMLVSEPADEDGEMRA